MGRGRRDATDATPPRLTVMDGPPVQAGPEAGDRFIGCATIVLAVGLLVVVVAALVVLPGVVAQGAVPAVVAIIGVVLAAVLPLLALGGLVSGAGWGIPVAVIALWLLVASGIAETVQALTRGTLSFPVLAIAALVVLMRPRPVVRGHLAMRLAAVALAAVTVTWSVVAPAALLSSSPLVVDETALDLRATLSGCTLGETGGPPEPAEIAIHWRWSDTEPVPWGVDAVLVEWAVADRTPNAEAGDGAGAYQLASLDVPAGAVEGDPPSVTGEAVEAELLEQRPGTASTTFWIDIGADGMHDGDAVAVLEPSVPPASGALEVIVTYFHRDAWQVIATPPACGW